MKRQEIRVCQSSARGSLKHTSIDNGQQANDYRVRGKHLRFRSNLGEDPDSGPTAQDRLLDTIWLVCKRSERNSLWLTKYSLHSTYAGRNQQ